MQFIRAPNVHEVCVNLKKEVLEFRRGGASLYPTCADKIFKSSRYFTETGKRKNRLKDMMKKLNSWKSMENLKLIIVCRVLADDMTLTIIDS